MAIQSTLVNTTMSIKYKDGIDAAGSDILKAKKFTNVKVTAIDEDILFIATTLGSLMKYEVVEVLRNNESVIVNN